jgi:hypothetical protein
VKLFRARGVVRTGTRDQRRADVPDAIGGSGEQRAGQSAVEAQLRVRLIDEERAGRDRVADIVTRDAVWVRHPLRCDDRTPRAQSASDPGAQLAGALRSRVLQRIVARCRDVGESASEGFARHQRVGGQPAGEPDDAGPRRGLLLELDDRGIHGGV